jgi:uncharacterized membrane protein
MQGAATARPELPAFLAFAFVPVFFHLVIVETGHVHLSLALSFAGLFKLGFVTISALTHWGIYSSLLLTFALTLRPGHEPLITAMARKMHGDIADELVVYTRRVTIAWCCFFAMQLIISVTLFCAAPLVVWSSFVNVFDVPLVVSMFSAEYMVRLRCLRNPPRHSLAMILKMVTDSAQRPARQRIVPVNTATSD